MAYSGPDELVLQSIRELAHSLDASRFEAVSHGIGLGALRPSARAHANVFREELAPAAVPAIPRGATPAAPAPAKAKGKARKDPAAPSRPAALAWLWVHMTDLSIVVLTLLLGLAFVNAFVISPSTFSLRHLDKVIVFRLYRDMGALNLVAATYGVFAAYWLFFRLFAGMTLGETLFRPRKIPKKSLEKRNSSPAAGT